MSDAFDEIEEITEQIDVAQADLVSLQDARQEVVSRIQAYKEALQASQSAAHELSRKLSNMREQFHNLSSMPDWASEGATEVNVAQDEGRRFLNSLITDLDGIATQADIALTLSPSPSGLLESLGGALVDGPASLIGLGVNTAAAAIGLGVDTTAAAIGLSVEAGTNIFVRGGKALTGSRSLLPIPLPAIQNLLEVNVGGKSMRVPIASFSISAKQWQASGRTAEKFAIDTTLAFMAAEKRLMTVVLGGPGAPDILSIDKLGRLISTEVKGSFSGTPLDRAGLLRNVRSADPLTGEKMYENSPEWHRRNAARVLSNLNRAAATATGGTQAQIREVASHYAKAMDLGFESNSITSEVFQVGERKELPMIEPSAMTQSFLADTYTDRVIQIDVVSDEKSGSAADANHADTGKGDAGGSFGETA